MKAPSKHRELPSKCTAINAPRLIAVPSSPGLGLRLGLRLGLGLATLASRERSYTHTLVFWLTPAEAADLGCMCADHTEQRTKDGA